MVLYQYKECKEIYFYYYLFHFVKNKKVTEPYQIIRSVTSLSHDVECNQAIVTAGSK